MLDAQGQLTLWCVIRYDRISNSPKLLCQSVLPESFKHEKDPNFPFSSELLYNWWSQMHKKALFVCKPFQEEQLELSIPGERLVLKFANCF